MGLVHADIELINPRDPGLRPIAVRALVDTGAISNTVALGARSDSPSPVLGEGWGGGTTMAPATFMNQRGAGAMVVTLCIPEHIALQMNLAELEKREVTVASGRASLVPYVGPVQVRFENRNCFTGALVLGDSVLRDAVLLGAVPLEDMDLVINPRLQQVTVNPLSPNIPAALVK